MTGNDKNPNPTDENVFSTGHEEEFDTAKKAADEGGDKYVLKFKTPFKFQDKVYEEITFDWSKLTGKDFITIESEMQDKGKALISASFSGDFIMLMATRAAVPTIPSDAFVYMSLGDFHRIRSAGRAFLLRAELGR
jgi:hypothetical protein